MLQLQWREAGERWERNSRVTAEVRLLYELLILGNSYPLKMQCQQYIERFW